MAAKGDDNQFIRINSLPGKQKKYAGTIIVRVCAKHNLREIQKEFGADSHIDAARTKDNYVLFGANTSDGVAKLQDEIMADTELPSVIRRNTIRVFETIYSIPPSLADAIDDRAYFSDCTQWQAEYPEFYGAPIISSVAHLDESTKHCHVLMLAVKDGKLQGSEIYQGKSAEILRMHENFYEIVGKKHGLSMPVIEKPLPYADRCEWAEGIVLAMEAQNGKRYEPFLRGDLLKLIANSPKAIGRTLGVNAPSASAKKKSTRTLADLAVLKAPASACDSPRETDLTARFHFPRETVQKKPFPFLCRETNSICPPAPAFSLPPIVLLADSPPALDSKESEKTHTARIEDAGALESKTKARAFDSALDSGVKEKIGDSAGGEADNDGFDCEAVPPVPDTPLRKPRGHAPTEADIALAWRMKKSGAHINEISEIVGCKKSTLYKLMPHPTKTLAAENQPGLWH